MNSRWQLQDAKNRFSEVVERALHDGPQQITRHGVKAAVVVSYEEYSRLTARSDRSLVEFFRASPLRGVRFGRRRDLPRSVDL